MIETEKTRVLGEERERNSKLINQFRDEAKVMRG
jgi:hypothetical protein